MVAQRGDAAADGSPLAVGLPGPFGTSARAPDGRGIHPGDAGQRCARLAVHLSYTGALLGRVGDRAGGRVRRGALAARWTRPTGSRKAWTAWRPASAVLTLTRRRHTGRGTDAADLRRMNRAMVV